MVQFFQLLHWWKIILHALHTLAWAFPSWYNQQGARKHTGQWKGLTGSSAIENTEVRVASWILKQVCRRQHPKRIKSEQSGPSLIPINGHGGGLSRNVLISGSCWWCQVWFFVVGISNSLSPICFVVCWSIVSFDSWKLVCFNFLYCLLRFVFILLKGVYLPSIQQSQWKNNFYCACNAMSSNSRTFPQRNDSRSIADSSQIQLGNFPRKVREFCFETNKAKMYLGGEIAQFTFKGFRLILFVCSSLFAEYLEGCQWATALGMKDRRYRRRPGRWMGQSCLLAEWHSRLGSSAP